ncbi:unnamed protein product [Parajaminaea phylloscopi]
MWAALRQSGITARVQFGEVIIGAAGSWSVSFSSLHLPGRPPQHSCTVVMAQSQTGTPSSGQRIEIPPASENPRISAVHPARPWPWAPPRSSTTGSQDANLNLLQAHYYIRHGERTPVRTRLTESNPPIPARWNFCQTARDFQAAVLTRPVHNEAALGQPSLGSQREVSLRRETEAIDAQGKRVPLLEGECLMGQLTDVGRQSTLTMGRYLREIYVQRLGLLPEEMRAGVDDGKLYVRSTNMSRTIESAQQVVTGLLGADSRQSSTFRPTILVRNGNVESLLPNTYSCPTLYKLDSHFSRSVATLLNPSLAVHDTVLSPHLAGVPLRVDGHPRLSGVLDTIRAAQAHGIPVPNAFKDANVVKDLERAVSDEWFSGYRAENPEQRAQYRRLAMGPLLSDLASHLSSAAAGQAKDLRLGIYSTHDTTLAGIMSTLDVFDRRWPAFTASIGVELWQDPSEARSASTAQPSMLAKLKFWKQPSPSSSQRHPGNYVRILYDGRPLLLPACDGKELCALDTFLSVVESLQKGNEGQKLTWEQECALGRGERSSK